MLNNTFTLSHAHACCCLLPSCNSCSRRRPACPHCNQGCHIHQWENMSKVQILQATAFTQTFRFSYNWPLCSLTHSLLFSRYRSNKQREQTRATFGRCCAGLRLPRVRLRSRLLDSYSPTRSSRLRFVLVVGSIKSIREFRVCSSSPCYR